MDLHAMTAGQQQKGLGVEEETEAAGAVSTAESSQFAKTVEVPAYVPMAGSVRGAKSAKGLRYAYTTK